MKENTSQYKLLIILNTYLLNQVIDKIYKLEKSYEKSWYIYYNKY